jgi:hypothetical protein
MTGLEAKSQYKSTMGDIAASAFGSAQSLDESGLAYDQAGLSLEASGIEYGRAGMEYSRSMDELAHDWEEDMYDYLFMLGETTGEWADFGLDDDDDDDDDGGLDPLYDPDEEEPIGEGGTQTGNNATWNPNSPNFDSSSWGPGNPYYDQNPDMNYWTDPHGGDDDDDPVIPPHTGP